MWFAERLRKERNPEKPKFTLCCFQGKIQLTHSTTPPTLKDLFFSHDARSKYFLENIKLFNMMFSFTSLEGKTGWSVNEGNAPPVFIMSGENYHIIESLLPAVGAPLKFAQ